MHEHWVKLALFLAAVLAFCRLFVVTNLGVWVAGGAVLALGVYAALLAEVPQLGDPSADCRPPEHSSRSTNRD